MFGDAQILAMRIAGFLWLAGLLLPAAQADPRRDVAERADVVRLPVEEAKGLRFHRLSTADGLSQTRVAQIVQDDLGFVWFGTQYGLNRYDGYNFKLFVHEPGNASSAAGTFVFSLFKDRDGLIWIGWSKGLDRLDPRTETFTHYPVEQDEGTHAATPSCTSPRIGRACCGSPRAPDCTGSILPPARSCTIATAPIRTACRRTP